MNVSKKITIDLNRPSKEVVHLDQNDTTREINLVLLCDGIPFAPEDGLTGVTKSVKYLASDGSGDENTGGVTIVSGTTNEYTVKLNHGETAVPGFTEVFVVFSKNGNILHTFPITLDVIKTDPNISPSESAYGMFLRKDTQTAKTSGMTQAVGVDDNGKLWTTPGGGGGGSNLLVVTLNSSGVPDTSSDDIYSAWQAEYIIKLRSSIGIEYDLQHCDAQKATFSTVINGSNAVIVDGYDIEGLTSTHYVLNGYVKPSGGIQATDMTAAVQAALAAAVPTVVTLTGSTPVITEAQDNTIYEAGELTSLTIQSIATGASFIVRFSSPAGTATVLTMPSGVYMPSGFTVEAYGRCEINVAGIYAAAMFWPFDS